MRQVKLGMWGPEVSEVCFGSLAISPLQGRVTEEEGVEVLRYALERGINWLDTAEIYDNYGQIAKALKGYPEVRIVSKSYAVTAEDMRKSIEKARKALNRDKIDFLCFMNRRGHSPLKGI